MSKTTAKIFRNGRNQAVRIPVEMSFETDTVAVEKEGDCLILRPAPSPGWQAYFRDASLRFPDDFTVPPDPEPQEREPFE